MGSPRPRTLVFDTGALIEVDRGAPRMRALLRLAVEERIGVLIPAGVLAEAWRDGSRQARLATMLGFKNTDVAVLDEAVAKAAGALCGRTGTSDIVDASLVVVARLSAATVITGDAADIRRLDPSLRIEAL